MSQSAEHTTTNDIMANASQQSKVNIFQSYPHEHGFERQYLALREKEGRIYSPGQLANLPDIGITHPHYNEWQVRKKSYKRLKNYLETQKRSVKILDVGCGNGWLANQLSIHVNCQVIGVDINRAELDQARQVFMENTECAFIFGDIRDGIPVDSKFDIVVFAASIQYFESLTEIINVAKTFLQPQGEIHILDTHFYKDAELDPARQRSAVHFKSLGFSEMASMYFHHTFTEVNSFNPTILYDPFSLTNRFFKSHSPFYWLRIRNE